MCVVALIILLEQLFMPYANRAAVWLTAAALFVYFALLLASASTAGRSAPPPANSDPHDDD